MSRILAVAPKTCSIPLEARIGELKGRIDFYLNVERLADKDGKAVYRSNRGALQVVIPVMLGNRMVGVQREVVGESDQGELHLLEEVPVQPGGARFAVGSGEQILERQGRQARLRRAVHCAVA